MDGSNHIFIITLHTPFLKLSKSVMFDEEFYVLFFLKLNL